MSGHRGKAFVAVTTLSLACDAWLDEWVDTPGDIMRGEITVGLLDAIRAASWALGGSRLIPGQLELDMAGGWPS